MWVWGAPRVPIFFAILRIRRTRPSFGLPTRAIMPPSCRLHTTSAASASSLIDHALGKATTTNTRDISDAPAPAPAPAGTTIPEVPVDTSVIVWGSFEVPFWHHE